MFAFFGLLQGVVWNTWSPINESAEAVFGFTTSNDIRNNKIFKILKYSLGMSVILCDFLSLS